MRKLWVLLKLNFRAMLRAFSFRSGAGSSKKKAVYPPLPPTKD